MLEVRQCEQGKVNKGKGLFAIANSTSQHNQINNGLIFDEGDTLFTEYPVDSEQLLLSRIYGPCCVICLRPVGTPLERIKKILSLSVNPVHLSNEEVSLLNVLFGRFYSSGVLVERTKQPCEYCGVITCSDRCYAALDRSCWHAVVCTSYLKDISSADELELIQHRISWKAFCHFSNQHHETFALAGRLCCRVVVAAQEQTSSPRSSHSVIENAQSSLLSYTGPNESWALSQSRRRGDPSLVEALEEESVVVRSLESFNKSHFRCTEAYKLLINTIDSYRRVVNLSYSSEELVSFAFFNQLLVQFDRVNADISLEEPLSIAFHHALNEGWDLIERCSPILSRMCSSIYPTQEWNIANKTLKDLVDNAFPDVLATSYCPRVGLMNHSCRPNVVIDFSWDDQSDIPTVLCIAKTLHPIRSGAECCIAYIDPDLSLDERHQCLKREYDFICSCTKCLADARQRKQQTTLAGTGSSR